MKWLFGTLSLFLLACSNDTTQKQPQTFLVEMRSMQFTPSSIAASIDDTILFINRDILVHDVTEENKNWSSGPLSTDQSFKKVVTKNEGFYCSLHPVMKGSILQE